MNLKTDQIKWSKVMPKTFLDHTALIHIILQTSPFLPAFILRQRVRLYDEIHVQHDYAKEEA